MKPYRDADTLRELYVERELSTHDLADRFDVTNSTIRYWMEKHGIDRRPVGGVVNRATYYVNVHGYVYARDREEMMPIHRLIAIAEHGIEAVKGNDVHHKNGIKWDNRPENLELLPISEHRSMHAREIAAGRERAADGTFV